MADFTHARGFIVPILDQDGQPIPGIGYNVVSSDDSVVRPGDTGAGGSAHWGVVLVSPGTATITVTRTADGATGSDKTIEVTEVALPEFEWSFGEPIAGSGF